ncbi:multidrug effflux MFS transporter [Paenibacillus campi]|uniref:multidrug effflux MFS transporter n=1 Tax=Paenibacillus campi TaxID=3106031 RepID=UPI002AFEBA8C|nr:multidrug effflux MFS transporter [Paenibacillus sp. SGZ-1014]
MSNKLLSKRTLSASSLTRSRRLGIALILGSLSAFAPLSIDMYLPALPTLADHLHTNASLAQLSLTACLLGLAFGQLVVGPLSDVKGRRMPLLISLVLYAISSLLCALTDNIWVLILLRFIQGVTGAAGIVISRAIVRDLYSGNELTRFFSLLMLINGVAPIAAPVIGGLLLKVVPWQGVFVVLAAIGAIMLVSVWFGLPETLPADRKATGGLSTTLRTFARLIGDRSFIGFALSQAFVMAAMFAYIAGSPFVIQDIFGVSAQGFSLFFALNGFGIILFSQLAGRLSRRFGEYRLLKLSLGIAFSASLALLIIAMAGGGLFAIASMLFLIVACVGSGGAMSTSLAMQNQGNSAGSASALLGLLPLTLGALASPLVGLGSGTTAIPMSIVIFGAELLAVLLFLLLVCGRQAKAVQH